MPRLEDYRQFDGLHWETGSVRNYLAAVGAKAPHTGQPYSEALLMGISGGAVMGYFTFAYTGYDPHVVILTRNTFDPLDTLLARLGVVQTRKQTTNPEKAVANLTDTLADGTPAIVWADHYTLPYNALLRDAGMWAMLPVLVYGYEQQQDTAWIADRARVPLTVTTGELATARGRAKNAKHRLMTLDHPDPEKLPSAVTAGIWDCIKLYTEAPPKGAAHSFGIAAYQHWADLLVQPKLRQSWAKEFPPGPKLYNGLRTAFEHVAIFGKDGNAERVKFAQFLDEAGVILRKPPLQHVADQFRRSGQAWDALGCALLPDSIPELGETRRLLLQRHHGFLARGSAALPEMQQIDKRLAALRQEMTTDFSLSGAEVQELCAVASEHVLQIRDIEAKAVAELSQVMSG
ncbi:MAG: BtrH N-terminal domain-containing protein [Caldilineaceae bacterium]